MECGGRPGCSAVVHRVVVAGNRRGDRNSRAFAKISASPSSGPRANSAACGDSKVVRRTFSAILLFPFCARLTARSRCFSLSDKRGQRGHRISTGRLATRATMDISPSIEKAASAVPAVSRPSRRHGIGSSPSRNDSPHQRMARSRMDLTLVEIRCEIRIRSRWRGKGDKLAHGQPPEYPGSLT